MLEKYKTLSLVYDENIITELYDEIKANDLGCEDYPSIDLFERLLQNKIQEKSLKDKVSKIKEIISLIDEQGFGYLDRIQAPFRDILFCRYKTEFHYKIIQTLGGYNSAVELKSKFGREEFMNTCLEISEDLCL